MKLQQYSGPVHAKGVEDTAFYRHNVLTSLNEVGSDPQQGPVSVADWHEANQRRLRAWPLEMIATSTHDTKRGEDHRARLDALSEFPDEWRRAVAHWMRTNASHRTLVAGQLAPARNDEYLFYQAVLGAWPAERPETAGAVPADLPARLTAFMVKAVREAKVHSSWVNPNEAYERAVATWVGGVLASTTTPRWLASFLPLQRRIAVAGMVNSLAQLTLKIASPGVADFYQGAELWNLSLVDPDNRRPVDYRLRCALLQGLRPLLDEVAEPLRSAAGGGPTLGERVSELLACWPDGRIKLYVTARGLRLRRATPALFLEGAYVPLSADDVGETHLVAFARRHAQRELLAVVPRLACHLRPAGLDLPVGATVWGTSRILLPADCRRATYLDLVTGETVKTREVSGGVALLAAEVLRRSPVALLWRNP